MTDAQVLQARLQETMVQLVSIQHQFDGVLKLYESAAVIPVPHLMQQYAEQLHAILDARLDAQNSACEYTRQLIKSMR